MKKNFLEKRVKGCSTHSLPDSSSYELKILHPPPHRFSSGHMKMFYGHFFGSEKIVNVNDGERDFKSARSCSPF